MSERMGRACGPGAAVAPVDALVRPPVPTQESFADRRQPFCRLGPRRREADICGRGARRAAHRPAGQRAGAQPVALSGEWTVDDEAAMLDTDGGSVTYRFESRDVSLVLAPPASGGAGRFAVRPGGLPPGEDRGVDGDESGEGVGDEPRVYQLVRQHGPIRERTFETRLLDRGVGAYVFTFG